MVPALRKQPGTVTDTLSERGPVMADRTCSVEGCEKSTAKGGRGWCGMHFMRWKSNGDPLIVQRCRSPHLSDRLDFRTARSAEPDGCWEWTGHRNARGAGLVAWQGGTVQTHRASYEVHVGPIPDGMEVCHRCDNPPCLRPDHLFLGDHARNMADMTAKGRQYSRLRVTDVQEIRDAYTDGTSMADLARRYLVNPGTISAVVHRRTWKHIA